MQLNRYSLFAVLLLIWGMSGVAAGQDAVAVEKTVLFIVGGPSHGSGEHEYDAGCHLLARHINEHALGVRAVVSLGWPGEDDLLAGADAIVIFSDGGEGHPVMGHLAQIDSLMKKGVGFMGIHYAVEVPEGDAGDYFLDWIGGYYETHWSVNPHWEADVTLNRDHPITRGVAPFSLLDEWYFNMRWRNDDARTVTSILRAVPDDVARSGESTWPPGPKEHIVDASGREETLLWAKERDDGGRGVGFTGAHFHHNWRNDDYRKLVLNAIVWIARGEIPADGVASPTPTKAEMEDRVKPAVEEDEEELEGAEDFERERRISDRDIEVAEDAILFASDVIDSETPGHAVNVDVDVEGLHTIFLVVTDAGDGIQCDFANWAEPHFSGPGGEVKLTDLEWETAAISYGEVGMGENAEGGELSIDNEPVEYGLGTHAASVIAYDVPRGMTRFKARCGLDSQGTNEDCGNTVRFMVLSKEPEFEVSDEFVREAEWSAEAISLVDETPRTLPGFHAEVVYRVPADAGSWVSLTTDGKGRLIASGQYGGLYRIVLGDERGDSEAERLDVNLSGCQGLLYAFDSLYAVVNGEGNSGLYRLRDTNGDDQFDEVKRLRSFTGNGEHGPHGVILSPDGEDIYVIGGNGSAAPDPETSRAPFNWGADRLLPELGGRLDEFEKAWPGGWVCKVDPEGKTFELMGSGFRNAYDIAFNADGELFTYDSDMEWDMGLPWYRPTRVNHITSGAEFGWRSGTGKWPDYYVDTLGSVADVGAGSPTGVTFGYGAAIPTKYQRALYILDWSYGKIYAMHLSPDGASYTGELETFVTGAPMPVCDMIVHPVDRSMYFVTGGRGTSSALYRVSYVGDDSTEEVPYADTRFAEARRQRRSLEAYHGGEHAGVVDSAWSFLGDADRHLRFAARIALENQPVPQWKERALAETDPRRLIAAVVALARTDESEGAQEAIVARLNTLDWGTLEESDRLGALRAYTLVITRFGDESDALRESLLTHLDTEFPGESQSVNREMARLLTYLNAPGLGARMVRMMREEPAQEEQLFYAMMLRNLGEEQWSVADHQYYFQWLNSSANVGGGVLLPDILAAIESDALDLVSDTRMAQLEDALRVESAPEPYAQFQDRDFVQQWTTDDVLPVSAEEMGNRDLESGRRTFAEAMCLKCHRFNQTGGVTGPNLTGVGKRYDMRTLVESIVEPSAVISDQYDTYVVITKEGDVHTGRIGDINRETVYLMLDLFNPADMVYVPHTEIEEIRRENLSMMPTALMDSFTRDEILDLIAYMQSAGD